MVATLLVDANLDGHAELLDMRLNTDAWREIREHVGVDFLLMHEAGLDRNTNDDVIWRFCQENGYYLLTANRNRKSDDSLEATIRREGTPESLPVFTFGEANRLYHSAEYLDKVVDKLLDYLLDEQNYRGVGRLYLP